MKCEESRTLLCGLYDHELGIINSIKMRLHIRKCPVCSQTLSDYAVIDAQILATDRAGKARIHVHKQVVPAYPTSVALAGITVLVAAMALHHTPNQTYSLYIEGIETGIFGTTNSLVNYQIRAWYKQPDLWRIQGPLAVDDIKPSNDIAIIHGKTADYFLEGSSDIKPVDPSLVIDSMRLEYALRPMPASKSEWTKSSAADAFFPSRKVSYSYAQYQGRKELIRTDHFQQKLIESDVPGRKYHYYYIIEHFTYIMKWDVETGRMIFLEVNITGTSTRTGKTIPLGVTLWNHFHYNTSVPASLFRLPGSGKQ